MGMSVLVGRVIVGGTDKNKTTTMWFVSLWLIVVLLSYGSFQWLSLLFLLKRKGNKKLLPTSKSWGRTSHHAGD